MISYCPSKKVTVPRKDCNILLGKDKKIKIRRYYINEAYQFKRMAMSIIIYLPTRTVLLIIIFKTLS